MVIYRALHVDRRWQVLAGLVAAATVAVVVAFAVAEDGAAIVPLAAEHTTTSAPPPGPLATIGPPPRKLALDWRVRLFARPDATQAEVVGGHLVVASTTALRVYNATTGTLRWSLSARDPAFDEFWEPHVTVDGRLVTIDRHVPGRPELWTTADLSSGQIVRNAHTPPPPRPTRTPPPPPGDVKITEGSGLAVDAPSGRNLYRNDHFSANTDMGTRQAGDYLVIPGADDRDLDRNLLAVINVHTGQAHTLTIPAISALDIDAHRIYVSTYPHPTRNLQIIDLISGARRNLQLPGPGNGSLHAPDSYPYQLMAVGGRLILAIDNPHDPRVDLISVSATR